MPNPYTFPYTPPISIVDSPRQTLSLGSLALPATNSELDTVFVGSGWISGRRLYSFIQPRLHQLTACSYPSYSVPQRAYTSVRTCLSNESFLDDRGYYSAYSNLDPSESSAPINDSGILPLPETLNDYENLRNNRECGLVARSPEQLNENIDFHDVRDSAFVNPSDQWLSSLQDANDGTKLVCVALTLERNVLTLAGSGL